MDTTLEIRPIRRDDDDEVARIIRVVMEEYGSTGEGSSYHDEEIDAISLSYGVDGAAYFVVWDGERILGGGGFGPLAGDESRSTCELRKMYFLPEARGRGLGRAMVEQCLDAARAAGYRTCYLETMSSMTEARKLYEAIGFETTSRPLGDTGHFGCDAWMRLGL